MTPTYRRWGCFSEMFKEIPKSCHYIFTPCRSKSDKQLLFLSIAFFSDSTFNAIILDFNNSSGNPKKGTRDRPSFFFSVLVLPTPGVYNVWMVVKLSIFKHCRWRRSEDDQWSLRQNFDLRSRFLLSLLASYMRGFTSHCIVSLYKFEIDKEP